MLNLHKTSNYNKHKNNQIKIVEMKNGVHKYKLVCAECSKKNFICWLNHKQVEMLNGTNHNQ